MAFAIWSIPHSKIFNAAKGEWKTFNFPNISDFKNSFIVKPFLRDSKLFALDIQDAEELKTAEPWLITQKMNLVEADKTPTNSFTNLVGKAVDFIKTNDKVDKIVLSRYREEDLAVLDPECLDQLRSTYPNAFVAMISAPQFGTWLVASPELFLSRKEKVLKSFSLAGTKTSQSNILGEKEKREQSIVTKFIEDVFEQHGLSFTTLENIEHASGHLTHLLNVVRAESVGALNLSEFLQSLHPTPAVGGQPKDLAMNFIQNYEGYKRELYTGFLGPLKSAHDFDFYVNLRSAQLFQSFIRYYAGAGITSQSNPQKEFDETEAKTRVLRNILS